MKNLKADEIIDLELFLAEDKTESEEYKNNRDFEFYSKASEFNKSDNIKLLSFWIEKMRALSGKTSMGKFSQMLYGIFALALIVIAGLLAYLFVGNFTSYFHLALGLFAASIFFIFSYLLLGFFAKILNWKIAFFTRICLGKNANISVAEKKNKNYFLAKGKFLSQFFGLAFVLAMFFATYLQFEKNFTLREADFVKAENLETIHSAMKIIALPWSLTMGEGLLYPSVEDIEYAEENTSFSPEEQSVWSNFLLAGIFVYGILPRLIIFFICLFKGRNSFGKYKISNDRDINILLNRMKLSSSNRTNWQSLKNDKDCQNLLVLRGDLVNYSEQIKKRASSQTKFENFNLHRYEFLSDFFSKDFALLQAPYKNFTIAFLADDYNDEVFENMQNLINSYPEKTLNVLLLGRYNASENSFEELVSVEKSWWERKLNAISTQNINIY